MVGFKFRSKWLESLFFLLCTTLHNPSWVLPFIHQNIYGSAAVCFTLCRAHIRDEDTNKRQFLPSSVLERSGLPRVLLHLPEWSEVIVQTHPPNTHTVSDFLKWRFALFSWKNLASCQAGCATATHEQHPLTYLSSGDIGATVHSRISLTFGSLIVTLKNHQT